MRSKIPVPTWMRESGAAIDVVLSTRCRIARNLQGIPFPWRADELQSKQVAELALASVERSGQFRNSLRVRGEAVNQEDAVRLVRSRYASREWITGGRNRWLIVSSDTDLSLLLNEEDHIRLQCIYPGLQVESVLLRGETAAQRISENAPFAFDSSFGYLTASLTNAGTGIRISVLLHLSGLASSGPDRLEQVLDAARSLGCSIRGLYGEGSFGTGELFQVSNSYSFGIEPRHIANRVESAARYLIEEERMARHSRYGNAGGRRALEATAKSTLEALYSQEASPAKLLQWVSTLRLAIAEGILPGSLCDTAEWVSIAGSEAAEQPSKDHARERYLAISRTSALRQKLRILSF